MTNRYRLELEEVHFDGTNMIDISVVIWDKEADNRVVNLKGIETLLNIQNEELQEIIYSQKFKDNTIEDDN